MKVKWSNNRQLSFTFSVDYGDIDNWLNNIEDGKSENDFDIEENKRSLGGLNPRWLKQQLFHKASVSPDKRSMLYRYYNAPSWMNYLTKIKRGELSMDGERRFANCLLIYLVTEKQKVNEYISSVCEENGMESGQCKKAKQEAGKLSLKVITQFRLFKSLL